MTDDNTPHMMAMQQLRGSPRDGDAQFVQAWILNEVLCEIMEGGTTESREIAARAVAHPRIKCAKANPLTEIIAAANKDRDIAKARIEKLEAALRCADQFITNGVELGYILMPSADTPDSAHKTPGIIRAALEQDK